MYEYDELSIYRGRDIQITNTIKITQPTLGQIEEFGEQKYFSAIHTLTSVGADLKWQLWDLGIDYTKIEDFDLFIKLTSQLLCSRKNNITSSTTDEEKKEKLLEWVSVHGTWLFNIAGGISVMRENIEKSAQKWLR